jgi:hypothetical protein
VVPEDPNGAEGPLAANRDVQFHIAFNRRGSAVQFVGGAWLLAELQERKIRELPVYLPHKFEAGLLETKEELDKLRESLR